MSGLPSAGTPARSSPPAADGRETVCVGILGGGQLGRMLALAGYPLGLRFRFLDPAADAPVAPVGELVRAPYDDPDGLERFVRGLDVVTYEFENVPAEAVGRVEGRVPIHPSTAALRVAQDRMAEKEEFQRLGIPTAPWSPVDSLEDLDRALDGIGVPAVLKTRRLGYDGKGQFVISTHRDAPSAFESLGGGARPLIVESFVRFRRELSILAVRGTDGSSVFYPLVQNRHAGGILRETLAPAPDVPDALQHTAEGYARRLLDHLDYVGVLALELFDAEDGLLANEMAPRVHNSGHWTIEGAECSQFENHLRAICGLPLGPTSPVGHAGMVNLLGRVPPLRELLRIPGAYVHLYDKASRPGRKLGHVTVRRDRAEDVLDGMSRLEGLLASD